MTAPQRKNIVVLGAGPTGLSTAWNLTEQGHKVTILEKSPYLGGLCRTIKDNGYYLDFGPHYIHSHKTDIIDFFKKILGKDLTPSLFKAKIYFNDHFVDYPLKGLNALKVLSWKLRIMAIFDFLLARFLMFIRNPKDVSFKDWITHRFGKTLFNIYFGPYASKAWKIAPDKISAYVAENRVPIISLTDYIRKVFRIKSKRFHKEFGPAVQSFYPKFGIGEVIDYFEEALKETDCKIIRECKVTSLLWQDNSIKKVCFEETESKYELETDFVISTIPINEFILLFDPAPPIAVVESAKNLDYCSERLFYIKLNQEKAFDASLVYFQDPKIRFNRLYNARAFSKDCVPSGKNALCFEFACSLGDDTWNASDDELCEYIIDTLKKESLLDISEQVEGYFSMKVTHAYPRFRIGFQENLQSIFTFLSGLDNAVTLGRQGLFCYANIDEVVSMGFRAVEYFNTLQNKTVNYHSLFQEYLHYE